MQKSCLVAGRRESFSKAKTPENSAREREIRDAASERERAYDIGLCGREREGDSLQVGSRLRGASRRQLSAARMRWKVPS